MKKVYSREWEDINNDVEAGCSRLKIHGGWLVVSWVNVGKKQKKLPEPLIFVPDPKHEWVLDD